MKRSKNYQESLKLVDKTKLYDTKEAGIEKGSDKAPKNKVGTINVDQLKKIAEMKMPDLNAANLDSAMSMIAGSCRSMGVVVEGWNEKK